MLGDDTARPKEPRWGWGGGSVPPLHQLGVWGNAASSISGVQAEPRLKSISNVQSTPVIIF